MGMTNGSCRQTAILLINKGSTNVYCYDGNTGGPPRSQL